MSVDFDLLHALPVSEKLRIVEFLWDDLGESADAIPLPSWVEAETARRRQEMADPTFGVPHDEAWRRIDARHG